MNGLARASLRFRPVAFAGTFVALLMAGMIVMACGVMLESGVRATAPAGRYAPVPVVAALDQRLTVKVSDEDSESVALPERARLSAAEVAKISALPGVASAVPDHTVPVTDGGEPLTARGWASAAPTGVALESGNAPGPGEVVLSGHAVGDRVTLGFADGPRTLRVSGTAPGVWLHDVPDRADAVLLTPEPGTSAGRLAEAVETVPGVRAFTGDERGELVEPRLAGAKETLMGLGGSFGGIAVMVAMFTAAATIALAVNQRRREFALLRAIGATPRQVRRTILTEGLIVAPVAAIAGCAPGYLLARWWFGALRERGAIPDGVELSVSGWPVLAAVGLSLLTALAAGPLAARRAAKIKPGQALTESAVERARPGIIRLVLGLAAAVGGGVMAGLAAGEGGEDAANLALGVVMLFMLAVSLLGPLIARACAGLFGLPLRGAGAPAGLAAANTKANARRLASAMTPIILAMAFSSTLVFLQTSMSHATSEQVEKGVTADRIVEGALSEPDLEAVRGLGGVEAAVGVLPSTLLYRSMGAPMTASMQAVDGPLGRVQDLDVRSGEIGALGPGKIAIDTLLADALHVEVGERAPIWLPDGTAAEPEVVAVYGRGLGLAQATLARQDVAGHVTSAFHTMIMVKGDSPELAKYGQVVTRSGYRERTDVDLAVNAWANNTMAGVLGGFAAITALNTLVMTVLDRRGEFGSLRLIGSTREQLFRMLGWESLLVTGAGALLGSAIAAATLIPMIHGLTGQAPYVPPLLYAAFVGATVLFGWLATTLPARLTLGNR